MDAVIRRLVSREAPASNAIMLIASAADGRAALEAVVREQPDVILLDVNMPFLDGFEGCRRLKGNPATRLIPVVLLTGLAAVEDQQVAGLHLLEDAAQPRRRGNAHRPGENGGVGFGLVGALAGSTDCIDRQRDAMRQQAQALVIRKSMDESPQCFRLAGETLGPRRMTFGTLPLGKTLVDAGRVSRKRRAPWQDLQGRAFAAVKERRQRQRMHKGDERGCRMLRQLVAQG